MRILYENTDITDSVMVRACVVREACGERCDSLRIEFDGAGRWMRWAPEVGDRIRVTQDGYDSGELILNSVTPREGRYAIYAASLPVTARKKVWRSYCGMTVSEIAWIAANMSGMGARLYGMEDGAEIGYIEQEDESAPKFLNRLCRLEGAVLRCAGGKFHLVDLKYAQARKPSWAVELRADQAGTDYRREGMALRALTARSANAEATARDANVGEQHVWAVEDWPQIRTREQAGRWARGLLADRNRRSECLSIEVSFNPALTALARVDVTGGTDHDGEWIVEEAEHDLFGGWSTAKMRRCVTGIY